MSTRTLQLYRALWEIDPQDENRADRRAAMLAAATVNSAGAKKTDGGTFNDWDFLPYVRAQIDPDELRRMEIERDEAELMAYLEKASGHKAHRYLES